MTEIRRKSWSVRALRWYRTLPRKLHTKKPGTEGWKKRIDKWDKKNGDKIFCGTITREHRPTPWRRDHLDQEVKQGLNTGTEQERVAGYKDLSVAGCKDLVANRSLLVMATQENVWIEDQMK